MHASFCPLRPYQLSMIQLTRLNHVPLILNSDLIEHIEVTPDTIITLTNGQKFMVLESSEEVVERVVWFRRAIVQASGRPILERSSSALSEAAQAHGRY